VDEVDVSFSGLIPVVMKSREAVELRFPIETVHPVVAKVHQKIPIHSEGRTGNRGGFGPSRLSQPAAQIFHRSL
jgi:hypothetical protein